MAINWAELKDLHVISKIQELITQWFNAEIFFTDLSGQVMSGIGIKNMILEISS